MDDSSSDFLTAPFIETCRLLLLERERSILARIAAQDMEDLPEAQRARHIRVTLPSIRAALLRITRGDYGCCVDCEEPIMQTRLELRPEALRCTHCQSIHDRQHPFAVPREVLIPMR